MSEQTDNDKLKNWKTV